MKTKAGERCLKLKKDAYAIFLGRFVCVYVNRIFKGCYSRKNSGSYVVLFAQNTSCSVDSAALARKVLLASKQSKQEKPLPKDYFSNAKDE